MTVCKDENQYLKEWIDYHLLIGFDHIRILDNLSKTPVQETVQEYIDKNLVSVEINHNKNDKSRQCKGFKKALEYDLYDYFWVACLDVDEFIVLLGDELNIKNYLKKYERFGAVALNWLMFGSNGHKKTQTSQIEKFTESFPKCSANRHVKCIIKPKNFRIFENMHYAYVDYTTVNVHGKRVQGPLTENFILYEKMRINHYYTRSEEDWNLKRNRGPGDGKNFKDTPEGDSIEGVKKYTKELFERYSHSGVQNHDIIKLIERIKNEKDSASNNNI